MSAVKAMQIAASKGQKIFTITKANKNKILPLLNHDSGSMQDINQALNAGKEVITHQSRINYKNWTGSGYAIIDPDTGAGAYLISGGANGAVAYFYGVWLASITALFFLMIVASSIAGGPLAIGAMLVLAMAIMPYILVILARVEKSLNPNNDPESAEFIRGCIFVGFVDANFFNVFFGKFLHGRLLGLFGFSIGKILSPGDTLKCWGIK